MTLHARQATHLDAILAWARRIDELRDLWHPAEQLVHLRPSSTGIRLVDLRPSRPQLDRGKIDSPASVRERFTRCLAKSYTNAPIRPTPEKRLQSWLLADAYRNGGTSPQLGLELVIDEQRVPGQGKDVVSDLLALRHSAHGFAPVVIELKSERHMARLVDQVLAFADVVDAHRDCFAALFGAVLGRTVDLTLPCERWIGVASASRQI